MAWIFRRSVKILPGVRLNFSRSGVGLSVGVPGARVSLSPSGRVTRTLGVPGTGIYNRTTIGTGRNRRVPSLSAPPVPALHADPVSSPFDSAIAFLHAGNLEAAKTQLQAALALRPEAGTVDVSVAPGLSVVLPRGRDAALLLLSEISQAEGHHEAALELLDEATPTSHALIAACELLLQLSRLSDVIEATHDLDFQDEASGFGLIYRAIALREVGEVDESIRTLTDIIRAELATPALLGQALFERGLSKEMMGQQRASTKDFESVPGGHWLFEAAQARLRGVVARQGRWGEGVDDSDPLPPLELPD